MYFGIYILSYINNCSDMSIGDTQIRVNIVIGHPQIQLAFIIPIYIKQVVIIILIIFKSIFRTYCYRIIYHIIASFELSLVLVLYPILYVYIYILLY